MDDLLKEAIADAKAVRETALENAKIALEEAFTPRLQSMLSRKIQSEIDVDEQEDEMEDDEEEAPEEGMTYEDEYSSDDESEDDMEDEMGEAHEEGHEDEDEEEMDVEGVIEINGVKYAPLVSEEEHEEEEEDEDDLDLEAVLRELEDEEDEEEATNKVAKLQSDLDEHRNVVKYLRTKLNEVNLLNAKLLFTNKLFRSFGLTNEQKMKVVENFDRAHNLREVKLVYSTLAESFGTRKHKTEIKETKGLASKAVASTKSEKQQVIAEGSELRERFKKLAGIL